MSGRFLIVPARRVHFLSVPEVLFFYRLHLQGKHVCSLRMTLFAVTYELSTGGTLSSVPAMEPKISYMLGECPARELQPCLSSSVL